MCFAAGEVDPEAMGWAVAIHDGRHLLGSLSVVMARSTPDTATQRIGDQVLRAALRIEGRLQSAGLPTRTGDDHG